MAMPALENETAAAAAPKAPPPAAAAHKPPDMALWRRFEAAVAERNAGRLDGAQRALETLREEYGPVPGVLFALGTIAARRRDHAKAAEFFRKAIAIYPGDAAYHAALGRSCAAQRKIEEAAAAFEAALRLEPRHKGALFNLGLARLGQGRPAEGKAACKAALALALTGLGKRLALKPRLWWAALFPVPARRSAAPRAARVACKRGIVLENAGETEKAIAYYRRALAQAPEDPFTLRRFGSALVETGGTGFGTVLLERAVAAAPGDAEARYALASALSKQGDQETAAEHYRAALGIDPAFTAALEGLGFACDRSGRIEEAERSWRRALELDPESARARLGLARLHVQHGRFEEAEAEARRILEAEPDCPEALAFLCNSRRVSRDSALFARILALAGRPDLPRRDRSDLNFAAAWVYRDGGDADKAFAHLKLANDLVDMTFDPDAEAAAIDRHIETFTPELFAERREFGHDSDVPVFIVGMPRSGTTLVEQIIASHPRAYGAGELKMIHRICNELPERLGTDLPYPLWARSLDRGTAADAGRAYADYVRAFDAGAARITDKMPTNFVHLGLIAMILPRARIIHCCRDPMDTCLSIYFSNFAEPQAYAYNLTNLGRFYREYRRLMAHWRRVLPVSMLDVPYEDLVADQEAVSRRIIAFLGLEWDARCLDFHRLERRVSTESKLQVRQPLYNSSVRRWRKYEPHLGPLKDALGV